MKYLIAICILFIFPHKVFSEGTKSYLRLDYGIANFESKKMDDLNVMPSGSTYSLETGTKYNNFELGLFYRLMDLKGNINHDGADNKIIHKGNMYGVALNFFLTNRLSVKFGYAVNNYKQSVATAVTADQLSSINNSYGIEENHSSGNVFYGLNLGAFVGKKYDVFINANLYPVSDSKKIISAQVGFRLYVDSFLDTAR